MVQGSDDWTTWCPRRPLWDGLDLDPCKRKQWLQAIIPIIICSFSILGLILRKCQPKQSIELFDDKDLEVPDNLADDETLRDAEASAIQAILEERESDEPHAGSVDSFKVKVAAIAFAAIESAISVAFVFVDPSYVGKLWSVTSSIAWILLLFLLTEALVSNSDSHGYRDQRFFLFSLSLLAQAADVRTYVLLGLDTTTIALASSQTAISLTWFIVELSLTEQTYGDRVKDGLSSPFDVGSSKFSMYFLSCFAPFVRRQLISKEESIPLPDYPMSIKPAHSVTAFRRSTAELACRLGRKPSLGLALLYFSRRDLWMILRWGTFISLTDAWKILMVKAILDFLDRRSRYGPHEAPLHLGLTLAFVSFIGGILNCVAIVRVAIWERTRLKPTLYGLMTSEVYSKLLRIRNVDGRHGLVFNLIAVDSYRISHLAFRPHLLLPQGPLNILIGLTMLYKLLGPAALFAVGSIVVTIPIQTKLARLGAKYQREVVVASDKRLTVLQELFLAIRYIKSLALETIFVERSLAARDVELSALVKRMMARSVQTALSMGQPFIVSALTFGAYTKIFGHTLDAPTAFASLTAVSVLRWPMNTFGQWISETTDAIVSLRRVESWLREPETHKWSTSDDKVEDVGFDDAIFVWDGDSCDDPFTLGPIKATFPKSSLTLLLGPVGAGKTMAIQSLLGETQLLEGSFHLPRPTNAFDLKPDASGHIDSVAYHAQSPWLMSKSLKENILNGTAYDRDRYEAVIRGCALQSDLAALEYGDETLIGERGVVLSGGQRARVSLARCLYSRARYLLLDDPLSAVDARTSQILAATLTGSLVTGRTVILSTHAVPLMLPLATAVLVLETGQVEFGGNSNDAALYLKGHMWSSPLPDTSTDLSEEHFASSPPQVRKEMQARGRVRWNVVFLYLRALGGPRVYLFLFIFYLAFQLSEVAMRYWLVYWTRQIGQTASAFWFTRDPITFGQASSDANDRFLLIYCSLGLLSVTLMAGRTFSIYLQGVAAGRMLFEQMLFILIGTRMRFWDSTPIGQIQNRCSRDISTIDEELSVQADVVIREFFQVTSILITISAVIPLFLIPGSFIFTAYAVTGWAFVTALTPGCVSIRAFGQSPHFLDDYLSATRAHAQASYVADISVRWMTCFGDVGGTVIELATILLLMLKGGDASIAGFALSCASGFSSAIQTFVNNNTQFELSLNSVERVADYLDLRSQQERAAGVLPPAAWPSKSSEVRFVNLSIRYSQELPLVLKEVSFTINRGKRCGVCGRTGSGKSTLLLSMLRFLEADEGSIYVDNVDISTVALKELRKRLTILPQEAVLFKGTVRSNLKLDGDSDADDADLYEALRLCRLVGASRLPSTLPSTNSLMSTGSDASFLEFGKRKTRDIRLDDEVVEGGLNFSAGQRQLLSLARAVLRLNHSSILLLDEISSSLDDANDEIIQRTIREATTGITTICIAHRLTTIGDYDQIVVLSEGRLVETGSPAELIVKEGGAYRELCKQSGDFQQLLRLAGIEE